MFFVVFNMRKQEYRILPREWVQEIDKHFCKFLKKSINRGQQFWCFHTTNDNAFELMNNFNVPKGSYKPNFQLTRTAENGDECFIGKFVSVEGNICTTLIYLNKTKEVAYNFFQFTTVL